MNTEMKAENKTKMGSSTLACPGYIPDINDVQNMANVRNTASFSWLYSGHRCTMSGIQPGFPGHIPDINVRCLEYSQVFLAILRTSMSFPGHHPDITSRNPDITVRIPDITVRIPDITVRIPDIIVLIPDITVLIPDINFMRKLRR